MLNNVVHKNVVRNLVSLLLIVAVASTACSRDGGGDELDTTDPPPLRLVHVDESPTPTTTFTDPVVGPGGPQERDDTSLPPVTYPSTGPDGSAVTEPRHTHGETDGAHTHDSTTTSEPAEDPAVPAGDTTSTTVSVRLRNAQNVTCGAGLVKLDVFVTETDNGCRRADCYGGGRNILTGECRPYDEWLDTLVRDCPTVDTSDGLGMYGGDIFISQGPGIPIIRTEPADPVFPLMVPGSSWVAHIQLVDNHNWDWWEGGLEPVELSHYFGVGVSAGRYVPQQDSFGKPGSTIFTTKEPEGSWTASFTIPASHPPQHVFGSGATARGAGCWAVRFERTS